MKIPSFSPKCLHPTCPANTLEHAGPGAGETQFIIDCFGCREDEHGGTPTPPAELSPPSSCTGTDPVLGGSQLCPPRANPHQPRASILAHPARQEGHEPGSTALRVPQPSPALQHPGNGLEFCTINKEISPGLCVGESHGPGSREGRGTAESRGCGGVPHSAQDVQVDRGCLDEGLEAAVDLLDGLALLGLPVPAALHDGINLGGAGAGPLQLPALSDALDGLREQGWSWDPRSGDPWEGGTPFCPSPQC